MDSAIHNPKHKTTTMKIKLTQLFAAALLGLSLTACTTPGGASTAGGTKPYPRTTCLVTGNDLDSMGGAITKVYGKQEVKFCCKPCVKKFEANQAQYMAKL